MPHFAMSDEQLPWSPPVDATRAIRTWAREWTQGAPHPLHRLIAAWSHLSRYHDHLCDRALSRVYRDAAEWLETAVREMSAVEVPSAMAAELSGLSPGTIRNQRSAGSLPPGSGRGGVPLASLPLAPTAPAAAKALRLMERTTDAKATGDVGQRGHAQSKALSTADRIAAKRRAS